MDRRSSYHRDAHDDTQSVGIFILDEAWRAIVLAETDVTRLG